MYIIGRLSVSIHAPSWHCIVVQVLATMDKGRAGRGAAAIQYMFLPHWASRISHPSGKLGFLREGASSVAANFKPTPVQAMGLACCSCWYLLLRIFFRAKNRHAESTLAPVTHSSEEDAARKKKRKEEQLERWRW